jgi:hypothetical protein
VRADVMVASGNVQTPPIGWQSFHNLSLKAVD